jgi:hypothetical protein
MREILIVGMLSVALIASCSTREVAVGTELPCPDPLVLVKADPEVRAHIDKMRDAEAGSDQRRTYEFFLHRAAKQKARRARLQEICRSTHQ